jgi:hypothetical protein
MHQVGDTSYGFSDELFPLYPDIPSVISKCLKTNTGKVYTVTKIVKLVAALRAKKISAQNPHKSTLVFKSTTVELLE